MVSSHFDEKTREAKQRLAKAGVEAKARFSKTKLGQKLEQTVNDVETKIPELKTSLQTKAEERIQQITETATGARDMAKTVAKAQVDQVLLNLSHKGLDLRDSNELAQRIGKSVLRRADEVRELIESHRMAPTWLKDLKLGDKLDHLSQKLTSFDETLDETTDAAAGEASEKRSRLDKTSEAAESTSMMDATAARASADVQPGTLRKTKKNTMVESEGGHSEVPSQTDADAQLKTKMSMSAARTGAKSETLTKSAKSTKAKKTKRASTSSEH